MSGLKPWQARNCALRFRAGEIECRGRPFGGTGSAGALVFDISIQSQLGSVKDLSVSDFEAREEVVFSRRFSNFSPDVWNTARRFRRIFSLSPFKFLLELDRSIGQEEAIKTFVFTFCSECARHARAEGRSGGATG